MTKFIDRNLRGRIFFEMKYLVGEAGICFFWGDADHYRTVDEFDFADGLLGGGMLKIVVTFGQDKLLVLRGQMSATIAGEFGISEKKQQENVKARLDDLLDLGFDEVYFG